MDTILALREKRKNLWDAAKNFLDTVRDENGMVSAEDAARYDKMEADVVNLGKEIDRLERQQQLDAQLAQPTTTPITELPGAGQNGAEEKGRASDAYRKAFWDSIRHKNFIDVQNALSIGTDADGGYLVPDEFEHQLIDKLQEENFFRSLATVIHTSGDRKIPVVTGHGEAAWMEENGLYPDSQDTFGQQSIGAYKLGTAIRVSEELLNDSVFDLESYIAGEFARRIFKGLKGEALSFESRLMACIDIYQALTEKRPYKVGYSHDKSIHIMEEMAKDGKIDGSIVNDMNQFFGPNAQVIQDYMAVK